MSLITWLRGHRAVANLAAAAVCFALFGYAVYSQYQLGLQPCPLCIFQRIGMLALGTAFLLAALLAIPRARLAGYLSVLLVMLAAGGAAGVAGRHVYIQSQPPGSVPACGADLAFLYDTFPLVDVVRKVLSGSGECSKVDWTFLGISMPGWVLAWALALGAIGVLVNWPRGRRAA